MKIKKETKHLNFYRSMMQPEGQRPYFLGLCNAAYDRDIDPNILAEIAPTDADYAELANWKLSSVWWGSGLPAMVLHHFAKPLFFLWLQSIMNYETSHNTSARVATGQFTCDTENIIR